MILARLFVILYAGFLFCVAFFHIEFWPVTNYPFFSNPHQFSDQGYYAVAGVTDRGDLEVLRRPTLSYPLLSNAIRNGDTALSSKTIARITALCPAQYLRCVPVKLEFSDTAAGPRFTPKVWP
ncbi:MAG: hypothetical protein ACXVCI_13945 [Bdellovibrionota bacterium]